MLRKRKFWIFSFLVLIIIGTALFFFVSGYRFGLIEGASMNPTIPDHSLLVAGPPKDVYKVGDVVVFDHKSYGEKNGDLVIHRIIDQSDSCFGEGPGFITKGDNNSNPDLLFVKAEDIEGIVVWHVPGLGYFFEPYVWDPCVIALLVLLVVLIIRRRRKGIQS